MSTFTILPTLVLFVFICILLFLCRSLLVHLENGYLGRGFDQFCPHLHHYNMYADNIYNASKVLGVGTQSFLITPVLDFFLPLLIFSQDVFFFFQHVIHCNYPNENLQFICSFIFGLFCLFQCMVSKIDVQDCNTLYYTHSLN